jgi:hypothetical protein
MNIKSVPKFEEFNAPYHRIEIKITRQITEEYLSELSYFVPYCGGMVRDMFGHQVCEGLHDSGRCLQWNGIGGSAAFKKYIRAEYFRVSGRK